MATILRKAKYNLELPSLEEIYGSVEDAAKKFERQCSSDYSKIAVVDYYYTTGLITRGFKTPKIIAVCRTTPRECFEYMFPRFTVTQFVRTDLFGDDCSRTLPKTGIAILPAKKIRGITKTVEEICKTERTKDFKRTNGIPQNELKSIEEQLNYIEGISNTSPSDYNPDNVARAKYIRKILKKYLK